MNNSSQTIKFVVAAAVMAGLAGLTSVLTRPTPIDDFANVGEPFFEDFKDPNLATAVRVVAYNEETASSRVFNVENKDGVWRIPSHHNYPADGEERLAKTARTLIGVKRGAVASRVAADHERFGVVDPLSDDTDTLKGRGQRLTLYKGKNNDIAVADLIIGKKLPEGENRYYVRHPEETKTFITELEVDISTKFSDWVEADLLKLDRDDLVRLQARSTKVEGQSFDEVVDATLSREKFSDPWMLEGLNEETEEVNKDGVNEMVNVLDNLKLSGIRRKPELAGKPILQGDLGIALPPSAARNPQIVNQVIDMVQSSLNSKGFLVYENREENDFRLYAKAGELVASLKDGVQFHMSFGNEFEGSEDEIEVGGTVSDETNSDSDQEETDSGESDSETDDQKSGEDEDEEKTKSRYLIVRASFDEELLGPTPVAPVKPDVPEGVQVDEEGNVIKPAEEKDEKPADAEQAKDDADSADDQDATPEKADDNEKTPDLGDVYQRAIEKYRADQKKYEEDLKARAEKVEEGKKKVDELNDRFADWYYVITEEDFDKLRLNREQLVKEKEKEESEDDAAKTDGASPGSNPAESVLKSPPGSEKPDAPANDAKTPAEAEEAKPTGDAQPGDPKAADEKKPAEEIKASDDKLTEGAEPTEAPAPTDDESSAKNADSSAEEKSDSAEASSDKEKPASK